MTQRRDIEAGRRQQREVISREELQKILLEGNHKILVEAAEKVGRSLAVGEAQIRGHQLRRFFSTVRRIEMDWLRMGASETGQRNLRLLKPRLHYQASRIDAVKRLEEALSPAIDLVLDQPTEEGRKKAFRNFVDFFEAIVAYHG
jgi:CRISPR-associated protein Csm2